MRVAWKLTVIVAIGMLLQAVMSRHAGELDEAQFAVHMLFAYVRGVPMDDQSVIEAAWALQDRQTARFERRLAAEIAAAGQNATTRPALAAAASIADDLELSFYAEVVP